MTGQKRAESSSFAIGRLEAKKGSTVTKMTQEFIVVTFRALILFVAKLAEMAEIEASH
jgi:preprotein translocase subunit SecA